jgi:uncharacterized membrane protein YdjX (TVP38/TMEM64 family)
MKNKKLLFKSIISLFLLLMMLILYKKLTLEDLQAIFEWLLENRNDADSYLVFFGASTIASMMFVPVSWIKAVGGLILDFWPALLLSWLSVNIGGIIVFIVTRYFGRNFRTSFLESKVKRDNGAIINALSNVNQNSLTLIMNLRMVPILPCSIINILCGISKVSFKNFMVGSLIGSIPGTFTVVYFSSQLTEIANNPYNIVLPLLLFISFNTFTFLYRKRKKILNNYRRVEI